MKNYVKRKSVRLKDMVDCFSDAGGVSGRKLIYEVFVKVIDFVNLAVTVIEPGKVSGEFFMTRGHRHRKQSPEFYVLLEGKGKLLVEKDGKSRVVELKKNGIALMPAGYSHRLINNGRQRLKVLTIFNENSGRSYGVEFRKRFFGK